jgi:predicted nucleotidyltransferase
MRSEGGEFCLCTDFEGSADSADDADSRYDIRRLRNSLADSVISRPPAGPPVRAGVGRKERHVITRQELIDRREAILDIARRHGAHDVRVIGSVARGDAEEASDLDLIVRFDPDRTLLDHGELIMDLQDLLHVQVDVISEAGMRERFRKHVMKEAIAL